MANSIELRVPVLNLEVIKRSFQFANNELVEMKKNKLPLRKLARKNLLKKYLN